MKNEGRQQQHGIIRNSVISPSPFNPRINSRAFNQFSSRSNSGFVPKISTTTTNMSKLNGNGGTGSKSKWTDCHVHPSYRSKDKIKGTQKLKSVGVVMNNRLTDKGLGMDYRGVSASAILGHLKSKDYWNDQMDDEDDYGADQLDDVYDGDESKPISLYLVKEEGSSSPSTGFEDEDEDDDHMSFCDVGFVIDQIDGDEDWCLVEEL